MVISKCIFTFVKFGFLSELSPFFIFHNFLHITSMKLQIKTNNISNYEQLENIVYSLFVLTEL